MSNFIEALAAIVGPDQVLAGPAAAPHLTDWRKRYTGAAQAVVRPADTAQVAAVVRLCAAHRVPLVTQGGNTGMVGGATPDATGAAIVLLTTRLNRVRALDPVNDTITVEAGCVLQSIQEAARAADRLFPLSLAAEGSCTIGGNLATNAGGTQVLRYGNTRELALGLEVVDAAGEVWDGLRGLRKDNTGYALRDLYIGSEGTLGIITAATLKLFPLPAARCTALLALPDVHAALAVLARARAGFGPGLTGYELMAGICLQMVERHFPQQRLPFAAPGKDAPWFALLELSDAEGEAHARARFEAVLAEAFEAGEVSDAVIAESMAQGRALWHLRESITLAQAEAGKSIKHDIALPISDIPAFLTETDALLQRRFPGIVNMTFGHLGDGNLHYNVGTSARYDGAAMSRDELAVYETVHDNVVRFKGSISAEHGVGQLEVDELVRYKSPLELRTMARIKAALDPLGILNPGKVVGPGA